MILDTRRDRLISAGLWLLVLVTTLLVIAAFLAVVTPEPPVFEAGLTPVPVIEEEQP